MWNFALKTNRSTFLQVWKMVAAGEGVEPSISAFKAQRVASYTIPQGQG
jgi:hypothetical protein